MSDLDSTTPRTYLEWETLLVRRRGLDASLASRLEKGSFEAGSDTRGFSLIQAFVERSLNAEKDRYLAALADATQLDDFELATRRFSTGAAHLLFFRGVQGLPEEAVVQLEDAVRGYVTHVLRMVAKDVEATDEAGLVCRREERRWRAW